MAKKEISKKQKGLSLEGLTKHNPYSKRLTDSKLVRKVLVEALMDGDIETVQDVLIAHLRTCSKIGLAKKSGLGRQTLYDLVSGKREFNPSLKTLGAILKTIAA
jgi:DNA-binding phage protein